MLQTSSLKKRAAWIGATFVVAVFATGLAGCAKSPAKYADPSTGITTTQTATALIEVATLKQWIGEGKLNSTAPNTRDRVVVVEVTSAASYAAGHIPGSVLWNSSTELAVGRIEGVAALTSEPPTGPAMDALIQRMGIDKYTTVVFSTSRGSNVLNMTRAYFTFRYWGFARERLKVLQGADSLWLSGGNSLSTVTPVVRPSTMSVRDNYTGSTACFSYRTAIGDMINTVDLVNADTTRASSPTGITILDVRGGVDPAVGPYVMNSKVDDYNQYLVTGLSAAFKPLSDMTARLATFGVTSSKAMTIVYCASGHRASSTFFVLDGMLKWPVTLYDGSSGQWLAYRTGNSVGANWRIDTNSPNTTRPRTFGVVPTNTTLTLDPISNTIYTSPTDARANQIMVEDKAYFTSGSTAGGGGGGGGGGSSSGC